MASKLSHDCSERKFAGSSEVGDDSRTIWIIYFEWAKGKQMRKLTGMTTILATYLTEASKEELKELRSIAIDNGMMAIAYVTLLEYERRENINLRSINVKKFHQKRAYFRGFNKAARKTYRRYHKKQKE